MIGNGDKTCKRKAEEHLVESKGCQRISVGCVACRYATVAVNQHRSRCFKCKAVSGVVRRPKRPPGLSYSPKRPSSPNLYSKLLKAITCEKNHHTSIKKKPSYIHVVACTCGRGAALCNRELPAQVCVDERIEVTIHNRLDIACVMPCTMVFHH